MVFLFRFVLNNLKEFRWLIVLAILVSFVQVFGTIGAAYSVKFITSKVSNQTNDPSCTFSFLGTNYRNGVLGLFDNPAIDPTLNLGPAPQSECPVMPGNQNSILHPIQTQHSLPGVIVFSLILLLLFSIVSAILSYFNLYIATFLAQPLSARLRTILFEHLQRI